MKRIVSIALAGALLAGLAACGTTQNPWANQYVSIKTQDAGINYSPATGVTAGYGSATGTFDPIITPDGKSLFTVAQPCGQSDIPATFANLNAKATASANSTSTAGGVNSPAIAWAGGDTTATGAAARILATGGGNAPTPGALTAYQNACPGAPNSLPNAPNGSIVVTGVSPSPVTTTTSSPLVSSSVSGAVVSALTPKQQ